MKTNTVRIMFLLIAGLALVLGMTLFAVAPADAQLKATNVVYAWDVAVNKFQNSMVVVYWDGGWTPFLHQVDNEFDSTVFISNGISTTLGGVMDYALYHTDNMPAGAPGWVMTRRWSLVFCDRTGDGAFTNDDLQKLGPTEYYEDPQYFIENLPVIYSDTVDIEHCGGNCQDEIETRLFVDMDKAPQDGLVDAKYRVGGVMTGAVPPICFYAEAKRPNQSVVTWKGNIQARITAGGGDKTVNFQPQPGPATAVHLSSFNASPGVEVALPQVSTLVVVLTSVLGIVASALIWRFRLRGA